MASTVLITGAGAGIGRAAALHYAAKGWKVFACVRKAADLDGFKGESKSIIPLLLDVAKDETVQDALKQVSVSVGTQGLDVLVNNAGVGYAGPLETQDWSDIDAIIQVNVLGVIRVTKAFIPLLRQGPKPGRIVIVSSVAGLVGCPLNSVYSASKWGLEGFADSLRIELAPQGIKVVVIEPGPVLTKMPLSLPGQLQAGLEKADPSIRPFYEKYTEQMTKIGEKEGLEKGAAPMSAVMSAFDKAILLSRPYPRYLVADTSFHFVKVLHNIMPTWMFDSVYSFMLTLVTSGLGKSETTDKKNM